jgi:hypothetical protein
VVPSRSRILTERTAEALIVYSDRSQVLWQSGTSAKT